MLKRDDIRPAWAEVNLNALAHNIREVRRLIGDQRKCCAVVKADAYGHGVIKTAKVFLENGADYLAVATLSEALELRQYYSDIPILILGYTPTHQVKEIVDNHITQTIYNLDMAKALSIYAQKANMKAKVHIKVDTGMNRLGFQVNEDNFRAIIYISKLSSIEIEGIYTHFAKADEKDKSFTHQQFKGFIQFIHRLEEQGVSIPIKHAANSAAIIDLPEYYMDMVRAGIMLYGLYPSNDVMKNNVELRPAMTLKTKLSNVKFVEEGEGISYGHIYSTKRASYLGTLPIGYADGYSRLLSGKTFVSIHGQSYPLVGRICMDQCMVLLNKTKAKIGEEVYLFGNGSHGEPHIDQIADILGTINYEVVCMVGRRVPRIYIDHEQIVSIKEYLKTEKYLCKLSSMF